MFKFCRPTYFAVFTPGINLATNFGSYLFVPVDLRGFGAGALGLGCPFLVYLRNVSNWNS